MTEMITVGEIVGVYGVKGWVKVRSWTQPTNKLFAYQPWLLFDRNDKALAGFDLEESRARHTSLVAKLGGCNDRETAATLRGVKIKIEREALPRLTGREYYWTDLQGLEVVNQQGVVFGTVTEVFNTGANDVMVVDGDHRRLVPFVLDVYVLEVDLALNTMLVDWDADF